MLSLREGHAGSDRLGQSPSDIKEIYVDDVYVKGTDENIKFDKLFAVEGVTKVERLTINNVTAETASNESGFLTIDDSAKVNELNLRSLRLKGFKKVIKGEENANEIYKDDIKLK